MTNIEIFIEILKTLPIVFLVYALTAAFSMPLGILGALGYTSNNKILKSALSFYTWIFRGTPLMLQLFFVFYCSIILQTIVCILWITVIKYIWI